MTRDASSAPGGDAGEPDVFDAMARILTETTTAGATDLPDASVETELVALRRLADVAQAAYLSRLAAFHRRGLADRQLVSTRSWARHHLRVAPAETSRDLAVIAGLDRLPGLAAAYAAGQMRYAHAHAIIDAGPRIGWETLAAAESELVAAAQTDDPTRLRRALRALGDLAESPRERIRRERRDSTGWLKLASTFQDLLTIDGTLSAEDGAIVSAAIDAFTCPTGPDDTRHIEQRRADALVELCRRALNTATGGRGRRADDAPNPGARRRAYSEDEAVPDSTTTKGSTAREEADPDVDTASALSVDDEAADDSAIDLPEGHGDDDEVGLPGSTSSEAGAESLHSEAGARSFRRSDRSTGRAHLIVVTDIATLTAGHTCCTHPDHQRHHPTRHLPGQPPPDGNSFGSDPGPSGSPPPESPPPESQIGLGETSTGALLPATVVQRLACDAAITRVVLDADGTPIDVGRTQRTVTPAQRHALRIRDRCCRFPGCRRPYEWTDAHHVTWWIHGGSTDLKNMILLCRFHHRAVHEGGWNIMAGDLSGTVTFVDPDGVVHESPPVRTTRELALSIHRSTIDETRREAPHLGHVAEVPGPPNGRRSRHGNPSPTRGPR